MSKLLLALSVLSSPLVLASTPVNVPLATATVENLGIVSDPASNTEGIFHDGGGGATQNGYHVQVFADSDTTSDGFNFVHNSVAYFGFRDASNPLDEYTFGMNGTTGDAIFTGDVPVGPITANETALGPDFAIWMLSGMTPMLDGSTILGVFPALNEGTSESLYSTMVQMTVVDPYDVAPGGNPPFTRLGTGRLFYPNEVNYGTFALSADIDGYLYLFGSDVTGVKLARVPDTASTIADRVAYEYYNSATGDWQGDPLALNNADGNIITWSSDPLGVVVGPNVGDVWYDPYHETTMMMWGDGGIDGTFWFSYATTNSLEGPWSTPVAIWTPFVPSGCDATSEAWNYQGHAHPGWDSTGKTLLISYASCALLPDIIIRWQNSILSFNRATVLRTSVGQMCSKRVKLDAEN
ncbi:uncharacterized protein LY89DRAFT_675969 [Mollisia scopiformis]|uniref:DUF4185 domain-containing protein n=1 Tax=Mollisia scopiformis TaxID=149040 RepID=A0A132BCU8_MOLSC|nr:uncharacterized protein LY89DRAFT_675969 [Mollisia scopiformis]KUJ09819.1 hypothetical protein LY89DRAFT_675969 [Mollisia scopiformis]